MYLCNSNNDSESSKKSDDRDAWDKLCRPCGWFYFEIYTTNKTLTVKSNGFELGYFSSKSKNEKEREDAKKSLEDTRNNILQNINRF